MVRRVKRAVCWRKFSARLATYLENTERLRKKVKTALMYPTVVMVVAIGITIFLLVKVIPDVQGCLCRLWRKIARPDPDIDGYQRYR